VVIHAITLRSCARHVSIGASQGAPLWYSRVPVGDVTCELYCRTRRIGDSVQVHFKGPPQEIKKFKFFKDAVKIEVQVHSCDSDDSICDGAMELAVPGLVSRCTTASSPKKCALDLADSMECCSVNKCLKTDDFQSTLMPGSLASLISTDTTLLLDKEDEATTTKSNESYTEETHAIDLTINVTVDTKSAKQVWVQF